MNDKTSAKQQKTNPVSPVNRSIFSRFGPGIKVIGVGLLILLLGIPIMLFGFINAERNAQARTAKITTADEWGGGTQRLLGPFLVVPIKIRKIKTITIQKENCDKSRDDCRQKQEETSLVREYIVFAPDELTGRTDIKVKELKRGIYKVPVYDTVTSMTGSFANLNPSEVATGSGAIIEWSKAFLAITVSDQRTFSDKASITFDDKTTDFSTGAAPSNYNAVKIKGIHAPILGLTTGSSHKFTINLAMKGGLVFGINPQGSNVEWHMSSNWPGPNFGGRFLPTKREINKDGFVADWTLPNISRNNEKVRRGENLRQIFGPQVKLSIKYNSNKLGAGGGRATELLVTMQQPVDFYAKISRALKYALLFIGLNFLAMFILEITNRPIHAIQYLFVGMGNAVFYLLLMAFAEMIGFNLAYLIAATATCILISLYMVAVLKSIHRAGVVAVVLITVYVVLWTILGLEDFALIAGAVTVFVALALAMFSTRNIDWYAGPGKAE